MVIVAKSKIMEDLGRRSRPARGVPQAAEQANSKHANANMEEEAVATLLFLRPELHMGGKLLG